MRRYLIFIIFACLLAVLSKAQEIGMTDTLSIHTDKLSKLLKNNDYSGKSELLNNFRSPVYMGQLKSTSESLILDSIVVLEWSDELQRIEKSLLYTCKFEDEGRTVLVDIMKWDPEKKKWVKGNHNYYWFNAEDKLEQVEFQEYVYPEYRHYIRIDYEYEDGRIKYESKYDRIDEIEVWDEIEQLEYNYNDNGSLKMVDINEWDNFLKEWVPNAYRLYNYDTMQVLNSIMGFDFDYFENVSEKKFELVYAYDSLGNILEEVEYIPGWDDEFVPERKKANTYGPNSELESETFYKWSYDANWWIGENKWEYSNQAEASLLRQLNTYLWNGQNNKWENSYQSDFITENVYATSDIQYWDFMMTYMPVYGFDGMVCDRIENHKMFNGAWESAGNMEYHFSDETIVGIWDEPNPKLRIYPNPVMDELIITTNNTPEWKLSLYDMNGRMILSRHLPGDTRLNVSSLQAGIYIAELQQNGRIQLVEKIVKH